MDALTIHRPERETKDNRPPSDSIRDFRFARPKPPVSAPSEELPLMSLAIVSDGPPPSISANRSTVVPLRAYFKAFAAVSLTNSDPVRIVCLEISPSMSPGICASNSSALIAASVWIPPRRPRDSALRRRG